MRATALEKGGLTTVIKRKNSTSELSPDVVSEKKGI
jgi:hypothetical protein